MSVSLIKKKLGFLIITIFVVFASLGTTGYLYVTPPWKVINPDDPRFDSMNFNFYDYGNGASDHKALIRTCEVIRRIIPAGTRKETVEGILVESGGAKIIPDSLDGGENKVVYKNPVETGYYYLLNKYTIQRQWFVIEYTTDERTNEIICLRRDPVGKSKFD